MPKRIVAPNLILAVDHVLWRWVLRVDQFRGDVEENGASVSHHLLYPKKIDGYSCNGERLPVAYSLGIVDVDLYGAFDRAAAHKYAGGQI
jgi:hypothetical protein